MIIVRLNGGLGNQLFQYACARALALRNNARVKLDLIRYRDPSYDETMPYGLDRLGIRAQPAGALELKLAHGGRFARAVARLAPRTRFALFEERGLQFHPEVVDARGNVYLIGFWECEKYFLDARETILEESRPKAPPSPQNARLLAEIGAAPSVSVHVRHGYRADRPEFRGLALAYYQRAIARMEKLAPSPRYFVFSDNPEWARANLALRDAVFVSVNGPDRPEEDLRLMRACSHHIIANSTLSWWGAWLCENPAKVVIAPTPWFLMPGKGKTDILPPQWIPVAGTEP